jgi:hypothetical protein
VALAWLEGVLPRLEPGAPIVWTLKNFSGGARAWREELGKMLGRGSKGCLEIDARRLRETLALHRAQPLCSSCHNRMDPLGLALENFNAMGMWREAERGLPVDPSGTLLGGEGFTRIHELKRILATGHAMDFYRTISEKMLTYALGRGLEYHDVPAVDDLVERLEKSGGRPSALFTGIIGSAPFQKTRAAGATDPEAASRPLPQRVDVRIKP